MKAHLEQIGSMKFRAKAEGSPAIVLHSPEGDGPYEAPSPVQACLLSAMACTASDIALILAKGRTKITALEIDADADRATTQPRVFTKIRMHYRVRGKGITESALVRAIELSTEKYCTVGVMLRRGGVAWENTHEIIEEA